MNELNALNKAEKDSHRKYNKIYQYSTKDVNSSPLFEVTDLKSNLNEGIYTSNKNYEISKIKKNI